MPIIHFILQDGTTRSLTGPNGGSVMETAVQNDIPGIIGACGGCLACATCHVYVHPDWWDRALGPTEEIAPEEEDMLDTAFDQRRCSRLSCQIILGDDLDGLTLSLPGSKTDWAE